MLRDPSWVKSRIAARILLRRYHGRLMARDYRFAKRFSDDPGVTDRLIGQALNWDTPAGKVLDQLVDALPAFRNWEIIVFGSAPLQIGLDPTFLSGDAGIIPAEDISGYCRTAQLLEGQAPIYVEPCTSNAFTVSPDWTLRAFRCQRRHVSLIFPHPIDILVSKIKRLDEKDLRAFRMVIEKTGHPTEAELVVALQRLVDIYRPSFDEESAGDPLHNTQVLWQELFGKSIDVRREIIAPAIEARRRNYGGGAAGLKEAVGKVGRGQAKA